MVSPIGTERCIVSFPIRINPVGSLSGLASECKVQLRKPPCLLTEVGKGVCPILVESIFPREDVYFGTPRAYFACVLMGLSGTAMNNVGSSPSSVDNLVNKSVGCAKDRGNDSSFIKLPIF